MWYSGKLAYLMAVTVVLSFFGGTTTSLAADEETIERLERIIQQQQEQIEAQAKAIERLECRVQEISEAQEAHPAPPMRAAASEDTRKAPDIRSGNDKVSVKLYGWVNKAVLYADDGEHDNWYVVDNDNSPTRIGLIGSTNPISDFKIGTRMEVMYRTNPSDDADQKQKNNFGDNSFKKRHFDVFLESGRFGKLSVGHGYTASDGSAEVDLSGTAVVGYSSLSDMAGGQFWYDSETKALSDTRIKDAFGNMDGLGRDDRVRYDSPTFWSFQVAGSVISGNASDVALNYGRKLGSFKVAGALAYSDPHGTSNKVEDTIDGSVSVLHDCGLNVTFSGGRQEHQSSDRDDGKLYYGKLGYRRGFFSIGETALAVDYGRNDDMDMDNDEAKSVGIMGVQYIEPWATEYYLGYRWHELDRDGADFDDINAVMSGFRVKF